MIRKTLARCSTIWRGPSLLRRREMNTTTKPNPYDEALSNTTYRWLFNEEQQLNMRRLSFDVEALGDAVARAVGATECKTIGILGEGSFNRVFILTANNGAEAVARIPFKSAGPRRLMTQSEVATMDFVRSRFGAPVPRVLAWEASSDNPVGSEYIIMEKCPGEDLGDLLSEAARSNEVVSGLAKLQRDLAAVRFSQFGSIFYKEDVDEELQARPLYAPGVPEDECSRRFRIGPSVDRQLYRGGRAELSIDRGPWYDVRSYVESAAKCEMEWIRVFGDSPSALVQDGARHGADRHLYRLQQWLHLAPAVLPTQSELCIPVLNHPDLSGGNVMLAIPNGDLAISGIMDWQGATVRPLFDISVPRFLDATPDDIHSLKSKGTDEDPSPSANGPEERTTFWVDSLGQLALAHRYIHTLSKFNPMLCDVMGSSHMSRLRDMKYCSSHSWSDGLALLEGTMMSLCDMYGNEIPAHPDYPSCPVSFDADERSQQAEGYKLHHKEASLEDLCRRYLAGRGILLQPDGGIVAKDFEDAQRHVAKFYEIGTRNLSERERNIIETVWPFRQGKFTLLLDPCQT